MMKKSSMIMLMKTYGYHQKDSKNYGCFYDDEDYSHTDINEEIID